MINSIDLLFSYDVSRKYIYDVCALSIFSLLCLLYCFVSMSCFIPAVSNSKCKCASVKWRIRNKNLKIQCYTSLLVTVMSGLVYHVYWTHYSHLILKYLINLHILSTIITWSCEMRWVTQWWNLIVHLCSSDHLYFFCEE